ncbi:CNPV284 putative interleukin binding protein [Canarypox virus]|uniref:CNPV284 putative interleukin binding protein n=1 Tax=Canarypox virus TaxID=44088 RepID=Q6VZ63_CNPV|nr:CNPV284 putative interleukin binding protein [Canarypox virus]AAR83630.1 CNPV284 putative interleukin binding protein [Canarypox virus]AWD84760.1 putative interleukin binding protein [Canarypox virus]
MNNNVKLMFMVFILILTKTIAQKMDAPTTTSYTTEEEDDSEEEDDNEDEPEQDCCKDETGCPYVSNSIYVSNGTTFNVVCVGCSSDYNNFTLLWMVNGTVIENNTDTGFTYNISVLDVSSNFSSATVLSSVNLNRHDYNNSNITCILNDPKGSKSDSFDTKSMNNRYEKIRYLKENNITLATEEEFNNYTITVKK